MNADRSSRCLIICVHLCSSAVLLCGCGKPNAANITVRKANQTLQNDVEQLSRELAASRATIDSLQRQATTVPVLPQDRVERLFTTAGIRFKRLTGGADLDPDKPGDEALKVYIEPFDESGDALKSAGSFVVEAFDLAVESGQDNRIGRWEFDTEQARKSWFGSAMLYQYVLTCPFERPPTHSDITVKATFTDELTRRQFTIQKVVKVGLAVPTANTAAAK
jgi:hypothetical protein